MPNSNEPNTRISDTNTINKEPASDVIDELAQEAAVNPWKDFVAGNIGGIAGIMAGHPFDTVKVCIQTQPNKYSSSTFGTFFKIFRNEGVKGLYKGMATPILGVGALNAIIFGVYGNTMRYLQELRGVDHDRTQLEYYTDVFIAGSLGGLMNCGLCSPMELIKTRIQSQSEGTQKQPKKSLYRRMKRSSLYRIPPTYAGPMDCVRLTYKREGYKGLFKGMNSTILRDMPSYGVYFLGYEFLKELLGDSPTALLAAGGGAGVFCWILSYPSDVIKSRIQSVPPKPYKGWDRYNGIMDCAKKSYRKGGWYVFFRGLNSSIVRAFPVNAVTFFVYETIMKM
ncbi:mitochondrial basic amino acids transporter [Acrasis kona]|uniref:Mitochondrial basic amino acids transporter n=1 Tax=Acrasis kona TaxID=1008807 RepID=A0AAW2ZHC8_9EUKA